MDLEGEEEETEGRVDQGEQETILCRIEEDIYTGRKDSQEGSNQTTQYNRKENQIE